ncbi:unnamed protein product [Symbiodinium sp. CCMP2592]|nr:unnamed protein product [Symbiodinium sp. CCMP2592]
MAVLFASAIVVLLVAFHITVIGVQVKGHAHTLATVFQKVHTFFLPLRDPRLDNKFEELTITLYSWAARTFIHAEMCILATLLFYACLAPTLCSVSRVLLFGLVYANSLEIIWKRSHLTLWRTRTMYFSVMAIIFVRSLLAAWSDVQHSGFDQLDLVIAIGCGVASLSCRIAVLPLVMVFIADTWSQSMVHGSSLFDTLLTNGQRCLCTISLVVLVEQLARVMIVSELDAHEALEAFRGIVRWSMDADVMLDSQFQIRDRPTRLELLLHRQDEMTGMSFLDLLSDDTAAHEFLNLGQKSIEQATSDKKVAPVARLGLKRETGGLVRGDICMVHIPDRLGQGSRYLLGFVEDPEASGVQPCDARLSVDRAAVAKSARRFRLASSASASSSQSNKKDPPISLTSCREIVDVSLFLDGQTEWFDIKEARMRFTRFEDRESGMPTLKHVVLPSEWQSTLPELQQAVWSTLGPDMGFVPQGLGPLHLRMPGILAEGNDGDLSLFARSSQLRLVQGANINQTQDGWNLSVQPVYLCLQLYNFAQLDHRGRPVELGAVSEFSSMQSEEPGH